MSLSRTDLLIVGCGMATAAGLTAPATCAAIRAKIDGFKETLTQALGGSPIIGAPVPLPWSGHGLQRLARLVVGPIRECLAADASLAMADVPLLLGVAELDRPGRPANLDATLLSLVECELGARFHSSSRLLPRGRGAGALALSMATELVQEHGFRRVVVAGVDTYLAEATLYALDDQSRLLTERNSNGFIPGEAGAAVLVGPDDGRPGLRVRGQGAALETATLLSGRPLRGDGLASAYRQALGACGLGMHEIDYRIADCSGEQYWFKECALAFARLIRVRREFQDFWHPADSIGETGAAAFLCVLSVAWWAAAKGYAPGPLALAQSASDDGIRTACILDAGGFDQFASAAARVA